MRFPANCLLVALIAALGGGRLRTARNRSGRVHVYWLDHGGRAWEFYRKGASRRPYWQNLVYFGRIARAPALDVHAESVLISAR